METTTTHREPILIEIPGIGFCPRPNSVDLGVIHTVETREVIEARTTEARDRFLNSGEATIYKRIAAHLPGAIVEASPSPYLRGGFHLAFEAGGVNLCHLLDIREEYTRISSFRSKPNGKCRITVGKYGERTSFPQKADGTHNYARIAQILASYISQAQTKQDLDLARNRNRSAVAKLSTELGLDSYSRPMNLSSSQVAECPIFVKVNIEQPMTADQARALHAALITLGLASLT